MDRGGVELFESEHSCFDSKRPSETLRRRNTELAALLRRFLVVDVETTTKKARRRVASPFDAENRVVYAATAAVYGEPVVYGPFAKRGEWRMPDLSDVSVLVGHNIKFDLLYCWGQEAVRDFFQRGGMAWDTMYAEYLLRGHRDESLSLNKLAPHYGLPVKDSYISEQWRKGVDTPDIDMERMIEYNKHDAANTRAIFLKQLRQAEKGMRLPLLMAQMDGLLATTEMEWNGLFIDRERVGELIAETEKRGGELLHRLRTELEPAAVRELNLEAAPFRYEFNWESLFQLRALFFGGQCKLTSSLPPDDDVPRQDQQQQQEEGGMRRRAKRKPKAEVLQLPGLVSDDWKQRCEAKFSVTGEWSVTHETLMSIKDTEEDPITVATAAVLVELKQLRKVLSTYLTSFNELCDDDGIIHPELHHCFTRTGRLSCANPNMQNVPRHSASETYPTKDCLASRFGAEGAVIETDYCQVEVVVLALLSQDAAMLDELEKGTDLHCKRLALKEKIGYDEVVQLCKVAKDPDWIQKRQMAKVFQFSRQYGAGKRSIAANTGLTIDEVEELIALEVKQYPGVEEFVSRVYRALADTLGRLSDDPQLGFYDAPSGNRWTFVQERDPYARSGSFAKRFRHTLVLNHPVQGFAAEIVLTCLGRLWRHFVANGNYEGRAFLVNTVHDCVWVDAHSSVAHDVARDMTRIMSGVEAAYDDAGFAIRRWPRFPVETYMGPTLSRLQPLISTSASTSQL